MVMRLFLLQYRPVRKSDCLESLGLVNIHFLSSTFVHCCLRNGWLGSSFASIFYWWRKKCTFEVCRWVSDHFSTGCTLWSVLVRGAKAVWIDQQMLCIFYGVAFKVLFRSKFSFYVFSFYGINNSSDLV